MVDVAQGRWPQDMRRVAQEPRSLAEEGTLEAVADQLIGSVRGFIREQPEAAALSALGIGFVLGWKLRPW